MVNLQKNVQVMQAVITTGILVLENMTILQDILKRVVYHGVNFRK